MHEEDETTLNVEIMTSSCFDYKNYGYTKRQLSPPTCNSSNSSSSSDVSSKSRKRIYGKSSRNKKFIGRKGAFLMVFFLVLFGFHLRLVRVTWEDWQLMSVAVKAGADAAFGSTYFDLIGLGNDNSNSMLGKGLRVVYDPAKYEFTTALCDSFQNPRGGATTTTTTTTTTNTENRGTSRIILSRTNHNQTFSFYIYQGYDTTSRELRRGRYENHHVTALSQRFLNYSTKHKVPLSSLTFIDVGANIGWFAFNLAALGVNVVAFEPMPENVEMIKASMCLAENRRSGVSDRITLYGHGLGAYQRECTVYSPDTDIGNGVVKCVPNGDDSDGVTVPVGSTERGNVLLRRLDDAVPPDTERRIVALKMDTGGFYEPAVLKGGMSLFRSQTGSSSGIDVVTTRFVPDRIAATTGANPLEYLRNFIKMRYAVENNGGAGGATEEYFGWEHIEDTSWEGFSGDLTFHSASFRGEAIGESTNHKSRMETTNSLQAMIDRKFPEPVADYRKAHERLVASCTTMANNPATNITNDAVSTISRESNGNRFSMMIYQSETDPTSSEVRGGNWQGNKIAALSETFMGYSAKHNVPLSSLTFVDIGANIGWLTFHLAALGVNVIAFEHLREKNLMIQQSMCLKDNLESGVSDRITLYGYGLGAREEACIVYSQNKDSGDRRVTCVQNDGELNIPSDSSIKGKIPVRRLDDVVKANKHSVLALRMDTSSYDIGMLEGGKNLLLEGGIGMIVMEYLPDVESDSTNVKEFMKRFAVAGYLLEKNQREGKFYSRDEMVDMNLIGSLGDVTMRKL